MSYETKLKLTFFCIFLPKAHQLLQLHVSSFQHLSLLFDVNGVEKIEDEKKETTIKRFSPIRMHRKQFDIKVKNKCTTIKISHSHSSLSFFTFYTDSFSLTHTNQGWWSRRLHTVQFFLEILITYKYLGCKKTLALQSIKSKQNEAVN